MDGDLSGTVFFLFGAAILWAVIYFVPHFPYGS